MVRSLVEKHKHVFLFFQESELTSFDNRPVRSLKGSLLNRSMSVNTDGKARGLISLWNEDLFTCKVCITGKRYIILAGELVILKKEAAFYNIYASNEERERKQLWDFLYTTQTTFSMPWCLSGDFNAILNPSERKGGESAVGSIRSFNEFILKAKVVDIPMIGSPFTWTNNMERDSWARLDPFLFSPTMLLWFPKLSQRGLHRALSNHNAILVKWNVKDSTKMEDKLATIEAKAVVKRLVGWIETREDKYNDGVVEESSLEEAKLEAKVVH
ncbi:hypothetical protein Ddye_016258 [Dipteronia dyeriana]|uniref:Endonuclease/exonuclease/phosphatase domain-containing protein n=1 Tax=Dipteronia dyeriana TaxID=168575 RepID=A0AAD9U7C3_9ROSI|nr:hypothetical protein Ddye_016258 [Dipteronia dyeriana]